MRGILYLDKHRNINSHSVWLYLFENQARITSLFYILIKPGLNPDNPVLNYTHDQNKK